MVIIKSIKEMHEFSDRLRIEGKKIGFVPTMGALHNGHGSLIKRSSDENDITIVSIFVNPIQFGPNEDFNKYPRTFDEDVIMVEKNGGNVIFYPDADEITPKDMLAFIDINKLQDNLCGVKRPGHFRGVCTIVGKLFNIVKPHNAYFGKKDIQQLYIIKKMVKDLNYDINIIPCEIVREIDGLAMSSRNRYLNETERSEALILSKAIKKAVLEIEKGEKSSQKIITMVKDMINQVKSAKIDYVSIVNENMEDVEIITNGNILALAVFIGTTRLIDNHIIGEKLCF